jgi:Kef-type K+ transport system membrane component KefB
MSFATLAVISLVAIVGPLLALPRRWHLPIILGELAAGIVLGADWQRSPAGGQRDLHLPG